MSGGTSAGGAVILEQLAADPHPALAELRANGPVTWVDALGGWLVTSFAAAEAVMRDDAGFTVDDPRFSTAQVVGPSMLSTDGAEHTRHRAPFTAAFRPAQVRRRFTAVVEDQVGRLLAGFAGRNRAELRTELAAALSVGVVAAGLGLGDTPIADVLAWYADIVRGVTEVSTHGVVPDAARTAFAALRSHVEAGIASGDPTSVLAGAVDGAQRLDVAEAVANAAVLMFGGIETTEGMIANAAWQLLTRPAQLAAVRADPGLLDAAIEESLRLEPAAAVVDRYATADITLADARIRAGDLVVVSLAGANRDPAVHPDPDTFDLHRPQPGRHLAFAQGPHVCLAAHLARLETRTALSALLAGFSGLRLVPADSSPPRGLIFRKPPAVTVTWD